MIEEVFIQSWNVKCLPWFDTLASIQQNPGFRLEVNTHNQYVFSKFEQVKN